VASASRAPVWPPSVGDYARLRDDDALAEIIDITGQSPNYRYILNIFVRNRVDPQVSRLEDLVPVWPEPTPPVDRLLHEALPDAAPSGRPHVAALPPDIDLLMLLVARDGWPDPGAGPQTRS
jgi:hypothetical protein